MRQLTLVFSRWDQLPGFEVALLTGGDQQSSLAVGRHRTEAQVCDLAVVGGRDGGVEHETVRDTRTVIETYTDRYT